MDQGPKQAPTWTSTQEISIGVGNRGQFRTWFVMDLDLAQETWFKGDEEQPVSYSAWDGSHNIYPLYPLYFIPISQSSWNLKLGSGQL